MSIIDQLISRLAPHECLGCGAEVGLICEGCALLLRPVLEQCYRCRQTSPGFLTCLVCRKVSNLHRVQATTIYEGIAKDLIWKLKFTGAQAAARSMAKEMTPFVGKKDPEVIIVPVPTATSRVRQRGYDQAKLLARAVAKRTHLRYADCLARNSQAHQVGSSRQQRLAQLAGAFRVRQPYFVRDAHIILIDDVVTTGATLEAAATALKAAGAAQIEALVFAQPKNLSESGL